MVNEPRAKWGLGFGLATRHREIRSRSENLYMLSLPPGPCRRNPGACVQLLAPQARALRGHGEHHLHPSRSAQEGLVHQQCVSGSSLPVSRLCSSSRSAQIPGSTWRVSAWTSLLRNLVFELPSLVAGVASFPKVLKTPRIYAGCSTFATVRIHCMGRIQPGLRLQDF